jgi:hypothetical protein
MSTLLDYFQNGYCNPLLLYFYDGLCDNLPVTEVADRWVNILYNAMDQIFKKVRVINKQKLSPWIDKEVRTSRKQLVKECKTKDMHCNIQNIKTYKKMVQYKKRQYISNVRDVLDNACGSNTQLFWNMLKSLPGSYKQQEQIAPEVVYQKLKSLSTMPKEKYFDLDFERECEKMLEGFDNESSICIISEPMLNILNDNITVEEVTNAVSKLKNKKAPGLDLIPAECVKCIIDFIKPHLVELFNYILSKEEYPDTWSEGLRLALPKGGGDIRPITIEPVFGNIFEIIMDQRLNFIGETFNQQDPYNGGFVKGSRTQDNMLIALGCIQKQIAQGECLYMALVDFKKAFNYVNRSILFYKIVKSGLKGRVIKVLRDMYAKIKAKVKIDGWLYEWIEDSCGTNQGGPLSPNMFKKMLDDLREFLKCDHGIVTLDEHVLVHMLWADDLILMANSAIGLQKHLDGLYKFCSRYQLIANNLKTKVMTFGKVAPGAPSRFKFNGRVLEITESYKYLGVIFNSVLQSRTNIFRDMATYTADKALKASFAVLKKYASLGRVPPKIGFQLFDSCVLPVLQYGSEIWSRGKELLSLERIHLRFIKMLLGVKRSTSTAALYVETGRFPLYLRFKINIVKYFIRLQNMEDGKIVKKVFNMLKHLDDVGFKVWTSDVRDILQEYNLEHYYNLSQFSMEQENMCINTLKEKVYTNFITNCLQELNNSPVLRCYINFKHDYGLEHYLLDIRDFKLRKVLSKFRLSSHNLQIENGRHSRPKIPVDRRLCSKCHLGQVEDEIHFLIQCPFYQRERNILFHQLKMNNCKITVNDTNEENFKNIMSAKGKNTFYVAVHLIKCFKKRDNAEGTD